jgi:integrase
VAKALTAKAIEALKGGNTRVEVPDGLLPGLFLIVQPTGRKSWAVRYRTRGQTRKLTLGTWPAIDLSSARELARKSLRTAAEGGDPASEKQAARRPSPLPRDEAESVIADFIEKHIRANTRSSTAREMMRLLNVNVVPLWRGRRIGEIRRQDVVDLMDGMIARGAPVSANRTLAVVRRMFSWAIERGLTETSPCDRVRAPTAERARDRVLQNEEIKALWSACDHVGWPFGPFVQLLLLTGQRRAEIAGMRWSEIDTIRKLWTLPQERVKNGRGHEVPLSEAALAILNQLPRIADSGDFVFSTKRNRPVSGFSRAKRRLDAAMTAQMLMTDKSGRLASSPEAPIRWRNHDLRRTMATGMAKLGVDLPVIEKVLNHTSGSFGGVVGIYQRHSFADEKRAALDKWGELVRQLVADRPAPYPK